MAYLDHDLGPEGPSRSRTRPITTQRTPAGSTAAPLLDLQRLAGNAAVSQAVRSGQFDAGLPVQRLADDYDQEETETEEEAAAEVEAGLEEEEAEVEGFEEELAGPEEEEALQG